MSIEDEKQAVRYLGERIGYGNMMNLASELWHEKLKADWNIDGGHFVVGPCAGGVVPCGCKTPHKCDWCNGCGWLTEHVKEVKDKMEKKGKK